MDKQIKLKIYELFSTLLKDEWIAFSAIHSSSCKSPEGKKFYEFMKTRIAEQCRH